MSNECADWMNEMRPIFEVVARLEEKGYKVIDYDEQDDGQVLFICKHGKEKFKFLLKI